MDINDEGGCTFASEAVERSEATADSDTGAGVAGDIWQQLGVSAAS
jgi:hypothetical protein